MLDYMGMGADLVLLAIDDRRGRIRNGRLLAMALAAVELIELAVGGCVGLSGGHLAVRGMDGVTRPDLVSALTRLSESRRPVTVAAWLAVRGEPGRVSSRMLELERAGVVRIDDPSKSVVGDGSVVVHLVSRELAQAAVERFSATARGTRTGAADEVFAALADAVGLTRIHLSGFSDRRVRSRISALTARRAQPPPEPDRTVLAIARAAVLAMAEAVRRSGDRGPVGSMAIPIDQQFGMQSGIWAAWNNPNIP